MLVERNNEKEKKKNFRTSVGSFPASLPPFPIRVGVGRSWALYDGVGVWPVAGVEEKWPGTEYGKRRYNSSSDGVPGMKENTDLRWGARHEIPRWENISLSTKPIRWIRKRKKKSFLIKNLRFFSPLVQ